MKDIILLLDAKFRQDVGGQALCDVLSFVGLRAYSFIPFFVTVFLLSPIHIICKFFRDSFFVSAKILLEHFLHFVSKKYHLFRSDCKHKFPCCSC